MPARRRRSRPTRHRRGIWALGDSFSGSKEDRRDEVEAKRGHDQDRRDHEASDDDSVGKAPRAGLALAAGELRGSVDEPITVAEERESDRDEERLVRFESREIADPGPADAEAEEDEWHDAARRCRERAEEAAGRHQPLPALRS